MMKRTHLALALAFVLLFLPRVNNKLVFIPLVLFFSFFPDIDSPSSYLGHYKIFRPLQGISGHRGAFHSLTFCVFFSLIFAFFLPILALPFFLGYSSHILADSFTIEGVMPFWPSKRVSSGFIRTGGKKESIVFIGLVVANVILFVRLFI